MALQPTPDQKIDRSSTTPFLLRLYYRSNAFHSPTEFASVPPPQSLQQSSLQIYTWPTCTLSELTSLLTSALPNLVPSPAVGTRIGYRLLFPDTRSVGNGAIGGDEGRGRWLSKEVGSVVIGAGVDALDNGDAEAANGNRAHVAPPFVSSLEGDADKTLADARFVIGDYVSCAIFPPLADGSVAPVPPAERAYGGGARAGMGGRDGGYGRGGHGGRAENGYGGDRGGGYRGEYRGGNGGRGGRGSTTERGYGGINVPSGDWRRGERVPEGAGGGSFDRGGAGGGRGRSYE